MWPTDESRIGKKTNKVGVVGGPPPPGSRDHIAAHLRSKQHEEQDSEDAIVGAEPREQRDHQVLLQDMQQVVDEPPAGPLPMRASHTN